MLGTNPPVAATPSTNPVLVLASRSSTTKGISSVNSVGYSSMVALSLLQRKAIRHQEKGVQPLTETGSCSQAVSVKRAVLSRSVC
jgi:hypothetical protein